MGRSPFPPYISIIFCSVCIAILFLLRLSLCNLPTHLFKPSVNLFPGKKPANLPKKTPLPLRRVFSQILLTLTFRLRTASIQITRILTLLQIFARGRGASRAPIWENLRFSLYDTPKTPTLRKRCLEEGDGRAVGRIDQKDGVK